MRFNNAHSTHRKTKKFFLLFFLFFSVLSVCSVGRLLLAVSGQFLLMEPIGESLETGDFSRFRDMSEEKISVNFEPPFDLKGYVTIDKFIDDFKSAFSRYQVTRTEWTSKQIEENFAVQSLNVILKDIRSEKDIYYKFIFFMKKKAEWKIYYLRGLKL